MATRSTEVFFPEPECFDEAPSNRDEDTLDWLARSTNWKAKESRRFLNENLNALPNAAVDYFMKNARAKWRSCFFELVVARTLQELGATILVEEPNEDGRRPDVKAQFPDGSIIVEAISPVFGAVVGESVKRQKPLLEIVEAITPKGWKCGVWELPDIGLQDSKKEFNAALKSLFSNIQLSEEPVELSVEISTGRIRLFLIPGYSKSGRSIVEPIQTVFDDSENRIKYALRRKKSQVRGSKEPVLLAIDAQELFCDFEDFDQALFGRTFEQVDFHGRTLKTGFDPDGIFASLRKEPPTYAGVLAYVGVGFQKCHNPILFQHPRFLGRLPEALNGLELRSYSAQAAEIEKIEGAVDVMERLNFVRRPRG